MIPSGEPLATQAIELEPFGTAEVEVITARRFVWAQGLRSGKFLLGLGIIVFFTLLAIFGPLIDTTDPSAIGPDSLSSPSLTHWLGTTQAGQDCLAQVIDGARISMIAGFVAGGIATVISVVVGLAGGYLAGAADEVLSTISNIFLVIPALPLVVVLAGYLPSKGWLSVAIVISVTSWAWGARVLRVQTLSLRKRDFVEAARATGEGTFHILFREIMPNLAALIASQLLFGVIFAILTEAGLAFLGLSNVSEWSWGTILFWAQSENALQVSAWWWFVPPGLCIAIVGTALALMNFGIDEFINPRLREAKVGTRKAHRHRATGPRKTTEAAS